MTLQQAIELLNKHQKWRMGDDEIPMQIPSEVTEAINVLLNYHIVDTNEMVSENHVPDVRKMVEISDEEIDKEWINYQKQFLEKFMKDTMIAGYAITNKETFAKWYREQLKKKQ